MPRGKRTFTPEENIARIDIAIQEHEATIKALKEERKQAEAELESLELAKLKDAIKNSGKSITEVIDLLSK